MKDFLVATSAKFSFGNLLREKYFNRTRTKALRKRESFSLEPIESRLLLSAVLVGTPDWQDQGPAPSEQGSVAVPQNNEVSGAVQSIAVNPNNASQIIVGTVNGGVWRTTNANIASPTTVTWTPLTDQLGSLAIGAVTYDAADTTGNTFYAGTGLFGNGFDTGGTAVGLYRTTDGGATWTLLGDDSSGVNILAGNRIKSVAINGQTILVGTINGTGIGNIVQPGDASRDYATLGGEMYRSTDGGATFALVTGTGLPTGAVTSVVINPNNTQQVFAAVAGQGVFRSDDGGANWVAFSTGLTNAVGSSDIELAIQNIGGTTLFATVATGNTLNGVFSANNFAGGGNWAALAGALPAGFNAGANFGEKVQIVADPATAGVVYIAGQAGTGISRYNPAGSNWVQIDAGGAQGTVPHVDTRDLVFLGNNTLLDADDGGIYFIQNPLTAATSSWNSFNGDLGSFEFYSVAYDSTNNVIIGGSQDNGSPYQNAANGATWTQALGGDGQFQAVDTTSLGGDVFRYSLSNNFSFFERNRFNNANVQLTPTATGGLVTDATNAGPIVITSNNHGLLNGDFVFINGVQGNTAANSNVGQAITVVDANRFSLNGTTGNGAYLGGGAWQRISPITDASGATGTPVVITTANNHRLATGDQVRIQGLTGSYAGLNNSRYYVTVTDATHYTLNGTASPDGTTAAGGFYSIDQAGISQSVMLKSAIGAADLSGLNAADQAFTGFSLMPFALNSVDPRMMMLGFNGLYEDADTNAVNGFAGDVVTTITPAGLGGLVTAIAYGGSRGGSDFTNVAVVGTTSGQLWFRGETGTAFTNISAQIATGGNKINSIALDPQDWRQVYVVSNNQVFFTADITNLVTNPFQVIGGGGTDNLNSLTSQLRSVEVVGSTPVVGGLGGLFRNIGGVWSEYGQSLPNTVVRDVQYDPTDDVLVASTFGRGAWTIENASTTIDVIGVLQITGDEDFSGQDDTIRLVIDAANPSLLDVFINGDMQQFQLSVIQQINVDSLGGNDTLIVDSSNGLINVANGIRYNGDGGVDDLQLVQTGGPTHVTDTYSIGAEVGSGVSTIVGSPGAGTQIVFFENLSPVLDLVPTASLTIEATATDNEINYSAGALLTTGLVTIDEHESIEFANKTALTINAVAGQDTINLNNLFTPTGLTGITVNGGAPNSGDTLIVTGVGAAVTVNTASRTITGASGAGGLVAINYTANTIESLNLAAGIGDLTLTTTVADDTVVVTPGLDPAGANSGAVQSSGAVPQIAFANTGTFTANLAGGNDALVVNASSLANTIAVSGTSVAITGSHTVNFTGTEALTVNGNAGSDTFNVTPSAVATFIDGGDPVGTLPGDLLNINAGVDPVTFNAGPETDEGGFMVGGNAPVSFDHIESLGITGGGSAVINGTNGPDTITVIARDSSTHAAADGVRDFTVSVNNGAELLFINQASLTINALSGSDQVTLRTPAPNPMGAWDVDVTVNGGPPAADTDRLIVETPGASAETVVYTPIAFDGGTLDLTSLSSLVTINTIEVLSYDGQGDNDSLTVVGTGGDDTIIHNPGSNDQAGSFQINSLLGLDYQNLGSTGSLTANGAGGADTLVYNGTAANDLFTIGSAGQVKLNSRLMLNTTAVEVLTLEGFAGDDSFTLVPAISASVYSTINLNGGGQASATGDRVFLVGTAGADTINISGQAISLGGKTVNSSGIEDIRLDALGGDDLIIYNGVSGITENITVSSSGIVGGGQVNVPGVALINFSGVERIDVNGNTPSPTETDTLTFAGTNAADTFQIKLSAAGTDGDPILKLLQNGSATPLLTLRNYTNFNTLRTLGLDGTDTFNVTTAGNSPSRNLFVDGGLPSGKKKSTDNLNVIYTPPRPRIIHSAATQDPDAGIVDLDYNTARFVVQYDDVEQVVIRKS